MRVSISSCSNNTKWRELQHHMAAASPRAPAWRVKCLPRKVPGAWQSEVINAEFSPGDPPLSRWDSDWQYHFRGPGWNVSNEYEAIEWCDLKPRPQRDGMSLDEIEIFCRRIGFDFERIDGFIRIYGYRRSSQ